MTVLFNKCFVVKDPIVNLDQKPIINVNEHGQLANMRVVLYVHIVHMKFANPDRA